LPVYLTVPCRWKKKKVINFLVENLGKRYSSDLEINLESNLSEEIFKWFLASILFGARISETLARRTYFEFKNRGVISPSVIINTGWDGLVRILDDGGYVRYDFKTATKLLEVMQNLKSDYGGDLHKIHQSAQDTRDLEKRIMALGKGIGEVTTNIFLRELRGIWEKSDPLPSPLVILAAQNIGWLKKDDQGEKALQKLKKIWEKEKVPGKSFVNLETALVRLGKDYCRKNKCPACFLRGGGVAGRCVIYPL